MGIAKHSLLHSGTYPDRLDDEEVTRATEADNVNVVGSNWNWFPMYIEWSGTGLADCQQKFASISKNSTKKYRRTRGTSKAEVGQNFRGSIFSRQNSVAVTFPANRHVMLAGRRDPLRRVAIGRGSSRAHFLAIIFLAIAFLDSFRFLDRKKSMRLCFSIADRHFFLVGPVCLHYCYGLSGVAQAIF